MNTELEIEQEYQSDNAVYGGFPEILPFHLTISDAAILIAVDQLIAMGASEVCRKLHLQTPNEQESVELINELKSGNFNTGKQVIQDVKDKFQSLLLSSYVEGLIEFFSKKKKLNNSVDTELTLISIKQLSRFYMIYNLFKGNFYNYIETEISLGCDYIFDETNIWILHIKALLNGRNSSLAPDEIRDANNVIFKEEVKHEAAKLLSVHQPTSLYPPRPRHRNSERYSSNREQVLGAAMALIAKYPLECSNNSGRVEASKLAELIDQKSPLFWADNGQPPLSRRKCEALIREWLRMLD